MYSEKKLFKLFLLLVCTLFISGTSCARENIASLSDEIVTKNYYEALIRTTPTPLAQLNLFANQLPKGGDLHHHYSGALYAETYLDWVEKKEYCVVRATFNVNFVVSAQKPDPECLSAAQIRADDTLYRQLLQHWSNKDFSNHFHLTTPPDVQFFNTFNYFTAISKVFYAEGLRVLKDRAKNENVQYLETMLARTPNETGAKLNSQLDSLTMRSREQTEIAKVQAQLEQAWSRLEHDETVQREISTYVADIDQVTEGLDDEAFTLRAQAYVGRVDRPAAVFASMYSGFKAAGQTSKIVGLNIVGPENSIIAMRDYRLHMEMFRYLKEKYPNVQLSLHAGELALGMVEPAGLRHHIREAVEVAGAKRIGHGLDIMYETDAQDLLKKMAHEKVAVEINLTSNAFIAGVSGSSHPVILYLQHGVPIVISTDDEGVSRSTMSNEYLLFISSYKPSYAVLKNTIYNSMTYSFLNETEKLQQKKLLDQRFKKFEHEITQSLGSFVGKK